MNIQALDAALADWYGRRSAEWKPADPLTKLLERVLGQRTTRAHALRAMANLRNHCRTWDDILTLPTEILMDLVRPAGLARQKAGAVRGVLEELRREVGECSLDLLAEMETAEATRFLRRLPGVGPHTAALVLLFALGRPGVMPVETHIDRVSRRLRLVPPEASMGAVQKAIESAAPDLNLMDLHVNLIRLGKEFCHAVGPTCLECPLMDHCPSARTLPPL